MRGTIATRKGQNHEKGENMFPRKRLATSNIMREIPFAWQLLLWALVDKLPSRIIFKSLNYPRRTGCRKLFIPKSVHRIGRNISSHRSFGQSRQKFTSSTIKHMLRCYSLTNTDSEDSTMQKEKLIWMQNLHPYELPI